VWNCYNFHNDFLLTTDMAHNLDPATLLFATAVLAFVSAGFSFLFAGGPPQQYREAREWGWAMATLGGACALWFLGPEASPLFTFFFANTLSVLAGVFSTRAFLRVTGAECRPALCFALLMLGMAGIVATYDFGMARGITVLSIAASHLAMVAIAIWRLWKQRASLQFPFGWVLFTAVLLLGGSILWRIWVTLFGAGALAVSPVANSDAQIAAIGAANLLILAASFGFFGILSGRRQQELLETARRDTLTGLYTRGAFFELARQALERRGGSHALLMIDLDHFKEINDTHGHAAGDAVIRHAARLVQQMIRVGDIAGRYGGEELCVFLPGCGSDTARDIAERINAETARQSVRLPDGVNISYTSSLGYVAHEGRADGMAPALDALLHSADLALYRAKRLGRNRVQAAGGADDAPRLRPAMQ
jgi:diguanylate cyclase (GGDEF)-like protein